MKDLDLWVFVSVFQEMLGAWLWVLLGIAVTGLAALAAVLLRDRGIASGRLVRSELLGIAGGVAALAIMWLATDSGPSDVGGPIDWVLIGGIWTIGAIGSAILAYAGMSLAAGAPRR